MFIRQILQYLVTGIDLSCGDLDVPLHIALYCLLCTVHAKFKYPICINL